MSDVIDLGDGHSLRYFSLKPDQELNPQYADLPDVERLGAVVTHKTPGGAACSGGIFFNSPAAARLFPGKDMWTVESWDPLTLAPSLLCRACGDHGYIRNGAWVRA